MTLRTGVLLLPTRPAGELVDLFRRIEALGYDDLWIPDERFFREPYPLLALAAAHTTRLRLAVGVTDPYSRHAALTAMAIATLDEISGGRAVLGMGAGVAGFRELGVEVRRPAVAMREAIDLIRRLLRGETVTAQGEFVRFTDGRLDFTPLRPAVPVYVASQREHGCRLAGRVADGAMMQGCVAPGLLRFFAGQVEAGARAAGRDPASIELVARINVCIDEDRKAARDVMRPTIVRSLVAQRPEFFTFVTAGLTVPPGLRERVLAVPYTHDPAPLMAVAPEVPDEFVDAVTLTGSPDDVAAGVVRLARAGIGQLCVYPLATDRNIVRTLERFQAEVMPRARRELGG